MKAIRKNLLRFLNMNTYRLPGRLPVAWRLRNGDQKVVIRDIHTDIPSVSGYIFVGKKGTLDLFEAACLPTRHLLALCLATLLRKKAVRLPYDELQERITGVAEEDLHIVFRKYGVMPMNDPIDEDTLQEMPFPRSDIEEKLSALPAGNTASDLMFSAMTRDYEFEILLHHGFAATSKQYIRLKTAR